MNKQFYVYLHIATETNQPKTVCRMNSVAAHMEYLLREHNCVVLPGLGAFICNYEPAHFDADNGNRLCPPGRRLAFNELIDNNDGLVASSISRRHGISFDAACRVISDEVGRIRRALSDAGSLRFGRLGTLTVTGSGHIAFEPAQYAGINGYLFGLQPIRLQPVAHETQSAASLPSVPSSAPLRAKEHQRRRISVRTVAMSVAASLAVLLTVGMLLVPPIRTSQPTQTASIAPVPTETPAIEPTVVSIPMPKEMPATVMPAADATQDAIVSETQSAKPAPAAAAVHASEKPAAQSQPRFNVDDPFCVIVASFPTRSQAESFVAAHSGKQLGILEKDAKFRVYGATGTTYNMANTQKQLTGQKDAWVCRR